MPRSIKATALICVLVVLMLIPVSAAGTIYRLPDYLVARTVAGNEVSYTFEIPFSPLIHYYDGDYIVEQGLLNGRWFDTSPYNGVLSPRFEIYPLGSKVVYGADMGGAIDVTDFVGGATVDFSTSFVIRIKWGYSQVAAGSTNIPYDALYDLFFYRADGTFISATSSPSYAGYITAPEVSGDTIGTSPDLYTFNQDYHVTFPEECTYFVPVLRFSFVNNDHEMNASIDSCQIVLNRMRLKAKENMILKQSLTMEEINDKMDELLDQPEHEKQEASSSGDDAADQLASAIPDYSKGFMASISRLTNAMRYSGTEAKLTFPAITLPEIPGIMPSYKLSDEQEIDFGFWVQQMPSSLLGITQAVLGMALYVYCFKELYSMISYALTLKGGRSDG